MRIKMQIKYLFVIYGIILITLSITIACRYSYASGFAIYTQSASALAQGNAVTAHQDDPSAVFFNPALIGKLSGTQFQIGSTLIHFSREFESSTVGESKAASADFFPQYVIRHTSLDREYNFRSGDFLPIWTRHRLGGNMGGAIYQYKFRTGNNQYQSSSKLDDNSENCSCLWNRLY